MQRDLMEVLQESFDKRIIFPEKVYQASYRKIMGLQEELAALKAELAELRADKARLDWLADKDNKIGNVSLPTAIVERTLMLRDSIDLAMQMTN